MTTPQSPHPTAHLPAGSLLLGRYEVVRVLGRGAMGEVVQVRDRHSSIEYALKRVPPDLARDDLQMRGIRANFALVSRLTHPHIATTRFLEIDPGGGGVYLLMDFVKGCDLAHWVLDLRERMGDPEAPLPLPLALGIAEQIAAGLDYAHSLPVSLRPDGSPARHGILHRDLKPANVMVETGRWYAPDVPYVRIVDFGLAAEIQASLASLTAGAAANELAGTPAYMSPEQWEGRSMTRGVDQWALGVMLYEMLAGRRPFNAPSNYALMMQVREPNPECPPTLTPAQWGALNRSFHYDRRARHPSCLALVNALASADASTTATVRVQAKPLPEDDPQRPSQQAPARPPGTPYQAPAYAQPAAGTPYQAPAQPPTPYAAPAARGTPYQAHAAAAVTPYHAPAAQPASATSPAARPPSFFHPVLWFMGLVLTVPIGFTAIAPVWGEFSGNDPLEWAVVMQFLGGPAMSCWMFVTLLLVRRWRKKLAHAPAVALDGATVAHVLLVLSLFPQLLVFWIPLAYNTPSSTPEWMHDPCYAIGGAMLLLWFLAGSLLLLAALRTRSNVPSLGWILVHMMHAVPGLATLAYMAVKEMA
ncbi:MAG: serine/threonine protein kinase [Planctomycetota bacterium]|nr:serine/threonine protein kinase [Planctomycetota bacterium]